MKEAGDSAFLSIESGGQDIPVNLGFKAVHRRRRAGADREERRNAAALGRFWCRPFVLRRVGPTDRSDGLSAQRSLVLLTGSRKHEGRHKLARVGLERPQLGAERPGPQGQSEGKPAHAPLGHVQRPTPLAIDRPFESASRARCASFARPPLYDPSAADACHRCHRVPPPSHLNGRGPGTAVRGGLCGRPACHPPTRHLPSPLSDTRSSLGSTL